MDIVLTLWLIVFMMLMVVLAMGAVLGEWAQRSMDEKMRRSEDDEQT